MDKPEITAERLREILDYDSETGQLTWRIRTSNRIRPGSAAGHASANGYLQVSVEGCRAYAHRLVWLHVYGVWPEDQIDHINGIRWDNRIINLREASNALNAQNKRKPPRHNTSGFLGVTWHKAAQRWAAVITVDARYRYLGLFATPEEAHVAYLDAKRLLHEGCTI